MYTMCKRHYNPLLIINCCQKPRLTMARVRYSVFITHKARPRMKVLPPLELYSSLVFIRFFVFCLSIRATSIELWCNHWNCSSMSTRQKNIWNVNTVAIWSGWYTRVGRHKNIYIGTMTLLNTDAVQKRLKNIFDRI